MTLHGGLIQRPLEVSALLLVWFLVGASKLDDRHERLLPARVFTDVYDIKIQHVFTFAVQPPCEVLGVTRVNEWTGVDVGRGESAPFE